MLMLLKAGGLRSLLFFFYSLQMEEDFFYITLFLCSLSLVEKRSINGYG